MKKKKNKSPKKSESGTRQKAAGSQKRSKFVEGLIDGKSMRKAALDAGYTQSMADKAGQKILPAVREQFESLLHGRISDAALIERIAEGLDALETKFAQKDGEFTEERDLIAWEARRRYAELICKLKGYLVERVEVGQSSDAPLSFDLNVRFTDPE